MKDLYVSRYLKRVLKQPETSAVMDREGGFKNYTGEDRSDTELEETWRMGGPEAQPASTQPSPHTCDVICPLMSDSTHWGIGTLVSLGSRLSTSCRLTKDKRKAGQGGRRRTGNSWLVSAT